MTRSLNYDQMFLLDAESLAEGGIGEAYEAVLPALRKFVESPAGVEELMDDQAPSYAVRACGREYAIYSAELHDSEGQSWGRATFAFFSIVNQQMTKSAHRFYAINGGNELGGMFLSQTERDAAVQVLDNSREWPYIPTEEHPWYGQPH